MELSYNLVRYGTLRILGVAGMYPSNDDCYRVEVKMDFPRNRKEVNYVDNYCPKPVYEMWKILSKVCDLVDRNDMEEMIKQFNGYGEWQYSRGSLDESMENSEDL